MKFLKALFARLFRHPATFVTVVGPVVEATLSASTALPPGYAPQVAPVAVAPAPVVK